MIELAVLSCPKCGAPYDEGSFLCKYCGSFIKEINTDSSQKLKELKKLALELWAVYAKRHQKKIMLNDLELRAEMDKLSGFDRNSQDLLIVERKQKLVEYLDELKRSGEETKILQQLESKEKRILARVDLQ